VFATAKQNLFIPSILFNAGNTKLAKQKYLVPIYLFHGRKLYQYFQYPLKKKIASQFIRA